MNAKLIMSIMLVGIVIISGCTDNQSPEEVKAKVLEAAKNTQSYKVDMQMDMSINQEGMTMEIPTTAKIIADAKNKKMRMDMSMSMMGTEMNTTMYLIGNAMYMATADPRSGETQWIKMEQETGTDLWGAQSQLEKEMELIGDATLEFLGEETIRGVDSWIVKVTPQEDSLEKYVKNAIGNSLAGGSGTDDMTFEFKEYTETFWISKDTYFITRDKAHINMTIGSKETAGDTVNMVIDSDAEMYDYNAPVDVSLPDEAKNAKTMEELMSEIGAGNYGYSASMGSSDIEPVMKMISQIIDEGFSEMEVSDIVNLASGLEVDEMETRDFQITYKGKPAGLHIDMYIDDIESPVNMYFYADTTTELIDEIEILIGEYMEASGTEGLMSGYFEEMPDAPEDVDEQPIDVNLNETLAGMPDRRGP